MKNTYSINEKKNDQIFDKMSPYLILAKNKISNSMNEHSDNSINRSKSVIEQISTNFIRKSQQKWHLNNFKDNNQKSQRRLSSTNNLTLLKNKSKLKNQKNFISKQKNEKLQSKQKRISIAQQIVSKWRKSYSGINLIPKDHSISRTKSKLFLAQVNKKDWSSKKDLSLKKQTDLLKPKTIVLSSLFSIPNFRQKKQIVLSVASTKKLYSSIRNYNKQQQLWIFHLKQQLSLKQTIQEFQKIELNRNVQPTKKLTMRQAYQLKKQIVIQIQHQESLTIQANIEKLAEIALDEKEKDKFLMIGFFMSIRERLKIKNQQKQKQQQDQENNEDQSNKGYQRAKHPQDHLEKIKKIQTGKFIVAHKSSTQKSLTKNLTFMKYPSFQYKKDVISYIKNQIKNWKHYKYQDPSIITIKILSILSLLLLKLQSPLLKEQDIQLISKAIQLKIKSQHIIDYLTQDQKRQHFEALIYLIFQFYKNLYYLKLDEELKIQHYNALRAYLDLYQTKDMPNYQKFQSIYRIDSIIQTIKPASVGIFPYQDSRVRNQIKFKTLQRQLINQQSDSVDDIKASKKPKIKINKRTFIQHTNKTEKQQNSDSQCSENSSDNILSSANNLSSQVLQQLYSGQQFSQILSTQKFQSESNKRLSKVPKSDKIQKQKIQFSNSRQKLSFKTLKKQDQQRKFFNKSNNNLKLSLSKNIRIPIKLYEKQKPKQKKSILKAQNYEFAFLFKKQNKMYRGQFSLQFAQNDTIFHFGIKIQDCNDQIILLYKFKGIKNQSQIINNNNFQKILWKVFKKIFIVNFIQQSDPFLMKERDQNVLHLRQFFANQDLEFQKKFKQVRRQKQGQISMVQNKILSKQLPLIQTIHDYLIYWLKIREFEYRFNGRTINLPYYNSQEINKYLENIDYEHDKKLFSKRQGYISPSSGRRRNSPSQPLSPTSPMKASNLVFNKITNSFFIEDSRYESSQQKLNDQIRSQKHFQFLLKAMISDRVEFKFIRLMFYHHLRQLHIFEIGLFKHHYTNVYLDNKLWKLRKIKNNQFKLRGKILHEIQDILHMNQNHFCIKFNSNQNNIENKLQNQITSKYYNNNTYNVEQQFQIDLTNQFKFIPTIQIKLINEISLLKLEQILSKLKLKKEKSINKLLLKKIQQNWISSTNNSQSNFSHFNKKSSSFLKTFKISSFLFLTIQFSYRWGARYLCLQKNLQFFKIINQIPLSQNNQKFKYILDKISIYKIAILLKQKQNIQEFEERQYYFYDARKPIVSKASSNISKSSNYLTKKQNLRKKSTQSNNLLIIDKHKDPSSLSYRYQNQQIHFLEQKIYFTLKFQKLVKYKKPNQIQFYAFQIYQILQKENKTDQNNDQLATNACNFNLSETSENNENFLAQLKIPDKSFLYQLIDLKHTEQKYYLLSSKSILSSLFEIANCSIFLLQFLDLQKFTLFDQRMELFSLPVHQVSFTNAYYEKKTKLVRKKVISEANYYFEQRFLQKYNKIINQDILIEMIHDSNNFGHISDEIQQIQEH